MVKLASALSHNAQLLNFDKNYTNAVRGNDRSRTTAFDFLATDLKPFNVRNEATALQVADLLNRSHLISKFNYALVRNENWDIAQHRLLLHFTLADQYASNVILLKGLFAFVDPKVLSISFDHNAEIFELEVRVDETDRVLNYLQGVLHQLQKEINFKEKLKQVRQWERHVKQQQQLIYNSSYTSAFA